MQSGIRYVKNTKIKFNFFKNLLNKEQQKKYDRLVNFFLMNFLRNDFEIQINMYLYASKF